MRSPRSLPDVDAGLRGDVGECEVPVVVIQVILAVHRRVGDEEIVEAVAVVIGHRRRRAQRGVARHDVRVGILELPIVMRVRDTGFRGDVLEAGLNRSPGSGEPGGRQQRQNDPHRASRCPATGA